MAGNTNANAGSDVCPITLCPITVKQGFKVCQDPSIYESKALAEYVSRYWRF